MSDTSVEHMSIMIRLLSSLSAAVKLSALDVAPRTNRTPRSVVSDIRDQAHRLRTDPEVGPGLAVLLAECLVGLQLMRISPMAALELAYHARLALDGRDTPLTPDEVIAALSRAT